MKSALLVSAACLTAALPAIADARRPNIIVVVTDDQRFDALGVVQREQGAQARFPFFETPNLDRLAAEGARFRNAFVTHSLCSPSRASMLTGKQTYAHGIRDNKTAFRSEQTWAHALRAAGYRTGYFGKFHMGRQEDRPGFTDTFTFVDQGIYPNCRFLQNGVWVETQGWVDDVTTDHAIDYVRANSAQSFAMFIGYKTPHDNRTPAPRHAQRYAEATISPPPNLAARPPFPAPALKPWNPRVQDTLNYFRCLQGVDDNIGRLLDALTANGVADDTLLIFAGDNGYYLGEHGLGDKRTAYEESVRIPLIVRYPRAVQAGTLVDAMALNIDFAATIMEFAGVPLHWPQQGRSLLPLLRGQVPEDWRREFYYENYQDPEYADVTFDVVAIRTERAKLVEYPGHSGWAQVFDLAADPSELHNLIAEPAAAALVADLRARLEAAKRNTGSVGTFKQP
ncbi:MAG: sulfatase [Lacunisphaera sp.]|nr:sulfatase [Lacunisphaera sp.]